MNDKPIPLIVGVAQYKQPKDLAQPLDPLGLITKTCQMVIEDVADDKIKEYIDMVHVLNINSWSYKDAPGELSDNLGIKPKQKFYYSDSGNYPQLLVNRAAKAIASNEARAVLITGGESRYSISGANKRKFALNWPKKIPYDCMEGELYFETLHKFEYNYGLWNPAYTYALFETALRAESGRNLEEHNLYLGKLFEPFSKVASQNPYAWIQKFYTAEEISTPTPENRNVVHPYTKRMCANMFVDQAGALIMTSDSIAEELAIDTKKWVNLMGGIHLQNIERISQRPNLVESPAIREGSKLALKQAGLKIDDIDLFDIYSCFPSVVSIIRNELGLAEEDPRQLTLTGGNTFFGSPWSIYSLHAIITAVELIRKNMKLKIMVIANGGYNTKQSIGIYGTQPPIGFIDDETIKEMQESILEKELAPPVEEANGNLRIEAYTIIYHRNGNPERGIALGTLENGRRTLANIIATPDVFQKLVEQELVGKVFAVQFDSKLDCNLIKITN